MAEERGRVWVLEDSPLEAEMARRALSANQEVSLFDDGSVVLERIAAGTLPDVLVLDSQLLGVSGLEVCRSIRETHPSLELPILMLTVHGAKQDIIEALDAGANDYVTKPYHVAELVARVRTLVRTSRLMASQSARTRQLSLTADLGLAVSQGRGPSDIARRAADSIAGHLGAQCVEVWTLSGRDLQLTARVPGAEACIPVGIVHTALAEGKVVEARGAVALPLVVRDDTLGVLAVALREGVLDRSVLATTIYLLGLGLARARAEEDRFLILDRERNARAEAEAANRSKDDFLAMVSHELRTPLNAITGWTSLLLSGGLDEGRKRRAYETIDRNARSQAQLIDDLLDIGRITSGNLRLVESTFEVATVADMAFESIRLSAETRGVELVSEVAPTVGRITGDAARVQQVIWNLLSNAIKFTPKGGKVVLSVFREEEEGEEEEVRIVVTDSGQGISSDFLPRVFDRFKQADNSATRSRGGLGLGLAIVRHLVELHGGTIKAESEGLGKGAVFSVVLPTRPPANRRGSDATMKGPSEHAPIDRPREIEGLRILVVDDEPDARDLIRTLLESCKIHVVTAASAAEGMSALGDSRIDVILSDVAMPEEDGLSFIRRVRALPQEKGGNTRAIAITAYARLEDRTRALRAGFDAHVAKPLEPNELLAVLSSFAR